MAGSSVCLAADTSANTHQLRPLVDAGVPYRGKDIDFMMDYCRSLRIAGVMEWQYIELASELLLRLREPEQAIDLIRQWLHSHPSEKLATLALSVTGIQEGIPELVTRNAGSLPSIEEIDAPERGAAVVHVASTE